MKKIILSSIFAISLFVVSCTPSSTTNPAGTTLTTAGNGCEKILSCMISKDPTNAKDYQEAMDNLKKLTGDEKQAADALCQVYDVAAKLYGCN